MSAPRRSVLDAAAARMTGARRVGIDGVDGAGKTVFADELAEVLRASGQLVVRVSADGFHHPRAVRYRRGRDSPQGFWLDSYDLDRLRHDVLDPFGPGGSGRYRDAAHDVESDAAMNVAWRNAPEGAVLVLDGLFLHRDELVDAWDVSIFLDVPFAVSVPRVARRDGTEPDPTHPSVTRYVQGNKRYFAACAPWDRATVVVDNSDLAHPHITALR
jgi:uridine kinase